MSNHDLLLKRIEEACKLCNSQITYKALFFVDEFIQKQLSSISKNYPNVYQIYFSNIENASKQYLIVVNEAMKEASFEDLITLVKIKYNQKFSSLSHKDVLGILMANKIDHNFIGDILVYEEYLYFEITSNLVGYIQQHIQQIGRTKIAFEPVTYPIQKIQDYQTFQATIKSNRLDVIVKTITNQSREQTKNYILDGNIKVNQEATTNISKTILNNDILSIRKYGRYKITFDERVTKKGNLIVYYHKYI